MELTIVTPNKTLVDKKPMLEVLVPAERGQLNIFPGHSPLLTTLDAGVLKYKLDGGQENAVAISWGYCEVTPMGVKILAETAESADEIDKIRADEALKKSDQEISKADVTPDEIIKYRQKRKRAEARIEVANSK